MNDLDLQSGIALDIDETLSITGPFWIQQFLDIHGNPHKHCPKELFRNRWYYNKETEAISYDKVNTFIQPLSESNDAQKDLPLIPNANHIVEKIDAILHISCYITARPETVRESTETWLEMHGFPKRPIIMRPPKRKNGNQ